MNEKFLTSFLSEYFKDDIKICKQVISPGGCINKAFIVSLSNQKELFIKVNNCDNFSNFVQEKTSLKFLKDKSSLIIPDVIGLIKDDKHAYMILEKLEKSEENDQFYYKLGKGLAELHLNTSNQFGWFSDNFIGSLNQSNKYHKKWIDFFINERLEPHFKWCFKYNYLSLDYEKNVKNLYRNLENIFPTEPPSLLHGDFWTGNRMSTPQGPAIFDPASYFGFREMDIAMANLFGNLPTTFYHAYNEIYPLEKNFTERFYLCNLYPLLIHARLFGHAYIPDIKIILKRFN